LFGSEETISASDVVKFLSEHKDDPEILVEISSDGGYKTEGIEIYQLLKNSDKRIHMVIYKANSIATVITLAAEKKDRLIAENAQFVIHFARIDPMNLGIDPLTAEDFQKLAEEVERSDRQILDIYCSELGEEKRTELLAAMADERDLGAKGAIKLGFASGYYKKKKKEKATVEDFKGCLIEDHIASIIQNSMEKNEQLKKLDGIEATVVALKKAFVKMFSGDKHKNELTLPLAAGGNIYVIPTDTANPENLVGAKVYQVDADGMPLLDLAADDGEYALQDGRTLVVASGAVTEVKEAIDAKKLQEDLNAEKEKNTALQAEVENLKAVKAELETLKAEKATVEAAKTEMQKQVEKIENEFKTLQKAVRGDKKEKESDDDDTTAADFTKMSVQQRLYHLRKESKFK
jgi:ATP-dependent protease ClpP protease subunit